MSTALQAAFERASRLPEFEQEEVARILSSEIDEIGRRAGPESALAKLGREAWAEHEAGRTLSGTRSV